jgi:2-polyprenyl-3-methyl-5-hydroxy-6-metoxy-1,4-benzoquinol methylase
MLDQNGYKNTLGIDIDYSQITTAKKYGCNVLQKDVYSFLKNDKTIYDNIYCFDLLEHLEKSIQVDFLKEIYKHLDKNGFAVLQIPNAIAPLANYFRYIDFTHNISYTDVSINFLCKNAGFKYILTRPQHQESPHILYLKKPWANLFEQEFGISDMILTPNLVTILFKNEETYKEYLKKVKPIHNNYTKKFKYKHLGEKIFSVKNFYHFKIVTILGINFKIKTTTV